mgnify:CR=1 FL=1
MNQDACEPVVALAVTEELAKLEESSGQSVAPEAHGEPAEKIRVLLVEDEALIGGRGFERHGVGYQLGELSADHGTVQPDVNFTAMNLSCRQSGLHSSRDGE